MRRQAAILLTCLVAVSVGGEWLRAQDSPPTAAPQAPPEGQQPNVSTRDVTTPRVLTNVQPAYTEAAVRARIEGAVRLRGFVEPDGTITNIEVVQSLDAVNGLDEAAVNALKQWRFAPGTLNGKPVRMLISVDMTFALRSGPPQQAWPPGFETSAATATVEEVAEASGLRLTISRPGNWVVRRTGPPQEWLSLFSPESFENVTIQRAQRASFDLTWPVPEPLIRRVADVVRQSLPATTAETLATGQIEARPGMFWVWSQLRVATVPTPPGISPDANPFGEARIWMFSHTVNGSIVGVMCQLLLPRNLPASALDARVQRAASEFRAIVQTIDIEKLPE